jgi:O-antigen/teichoic acid export membrane protein
VTRILQVGLAMVASFVIARLLGPTGRGAYVTLTLLPGTLYAFGTFGIPASLTVFSGRGAGLRSLERRAVLFGLSLSALLIAAALVALPLLSGSVLQTAPASLIPWVLAAIPFQLTGSLMGSVLYGRQRIRGYNTIAVAQSAAVVVLVVALVAGAGLGVFGAVLAYVATTIGGAAAIGLELRRAIRDDDGAGKPASTREVFGYGLRLYPSAIAGFFNYRADIYLLNWLLASARSTGLYSLSVTFAELLFYVPDSVASIFLPRVAAASSEGSDASPAEVARLTLLVTAVVGMLLVPGAAILIAVLLPAFVDSFLPLVILLPGVVALSLVKVLNVYLVGRGHPQPTVVASGTSLVANLGLNLVLIPTLGIAGAACSSLVSYTLNAAMVVRASRTLSGEPIRAFVVPRTGDVARLWQVGRQLLAGLRRTAAEPGPR